MYQVSYTFTVPIQFVRDSLLYIYSESDLTSLKLRSNILFYIFKDSIKIILFFSYTKETVVNLQELHQILQKIWGLWDTMLWLYCVFTYFFVLAFIDYMLFLNKCFFTILYELHSQITEQVYPFLPFHLNISYLFDYAVLFTFFVIYNLKGEHHLVYRLPFNIIHGKKVYAAPPSELT